METLLLNPLLTYLLTYLSDYILQKGPRNQAFALGSPAFIGTQTPSCIHSFFFFFARPTDPPLREGERWETKHFMGMAKESSFCVETVVSRSSNFRMSV